jgi:eukaryotic-like serine/threonine-protein kinase
MTNAAEPGRVLADRYRLDTYIAVGGMGEVWQGTDLVLDRKVAVKLLRPEHADDVDLLVRFQAEARMAGLLSHPNIAQVYDFSGATPADPAYLVMEFVDGPSLARLLDDGALPPARTMDIIAQAARGLAAAHRAGLVHRDIKPGNLLVRDDGLVKVSDFGIARAESATPVTRTGVLPGTPGYMAPERAAGALATPAADLYSLGVVAHQCLAGQPPFQGDALAVAIAHMERDMPPLPASVPAPVAWLVGDLTRKDPRARPFSAEDVAARAERLRVTLAGAGQTSVEPDAQAAPVPEAPTPTRVDARPEGAPDAGEPESETLTEGARGSGPDVPGTSAAGEDATGGAEPAGDGVDLLRPRTWHMPERLAGAGDALGRFPGIGRIRSVPARVSLAVLALAVIGGAGFLGWLLGVRDSGPPARSSVAPPAATQPGPQGPADQPSQDPGPDDTPASTPSSTPKASRSSPAATPSPAPPSSPTATPSPTSPSSPTPTGPASPTPPPSSPAPAAGGRVAR